MRTLAVTMFATILATGVLAQPSVTVPVCESEPGRAAERITGAVERAQEFARTTPAGWMFRLVPNPEGWVLQVTTVGHDTEALSRLTPPWHFVPNARDIAGWHFRNADNTGGNDGSVNAPRQLREFIFSPAVGREIEYRGSGTTAEDVARVQAFGRGWIFVESFRLTPALRVERAAFEEMTFSACLTWPANTAMEATTRH